MAKEVIHTPALNKSSPKHLFYARREYKVRALEEIEPKHRRRFQDFWYLNSIFGKVDGHGNAIFPLSTGMSALNENKPHFAMDFVVDAYTAFVNYYEHAISKRRMRGLLGVVDGSFPRKAHVDPRGLHQRHLDEMKTNFLESYLYRYTDQIVNFSDFMRFYRLFIRNHVADFPLTLTGFILSNECPMRCSGLIIELAEAEHDKDKEKNDILNSRDFKKYLAMAARFGFKVDKNAPWALVADLSSPSMHHFMSKYCIDGDAKNIFSAFYYPSYLKDLDILDEFMLDCYYTFMTNHPYIVKRGICDGKLIKTRVKREVLMPEEIIREFSNRQRLDVYMKARLIECGYGREKTNSPEWRSVLDKTMVVFNRLGTSHGLRFMNDHIKKADPRTSKFQKVPGSPPAGHTGPIPPASVDSSLTIGQTADFTEEAAEAGFTSIAAEEEKRLRRAQEYVELRQQAVTAAGGTYTPMQRQKDIVIGQFQ